VLLVCVCVCVCVCVLFSCWLCMLCMVTRMAMSTSVSSSVFMPGWSLAFFYLGTL
jgi:hypothetical protein